MGQDPAAIREQIEQTRGHIGDTVDALGYKADVPARAKESVSEKVDALRSRITGAGSQVADATPDVHDVKHGAQQAVGVVQENPLGLAIGAAAVGFLAGMLLPGTKIENERIGPVADEVKEQARQTGQEALEHGRQIAQETAESATQKAQEAFSDVSEKAQESAQSHAQDMTESAKESAHRVQETATGEKAAPLSPGSGA
jgi:gas vesicle protein